VEAGLPGARSLTVIRRTSSREQSEEPSVSFYLSNHPCQKGCARQFAHLARGHWAGSESRNHWVRDACMREDRTRSKNHSLNCNLAALRVCLISLKASFYPDDSWPTMQEKSQYDPGIPFQMIVNHRSK
jgi:predicted transposase YbfD/YdcC